VRKLAVVTTLAAALVGVAGSRGQAPRAQLVAAAGDIACADSCRQEATARLLLKRRYDVILLLGDLQYGGATLDLFRRSYGASWGMSGLKAVTRPAPGNHEYESKGAAGYFAYFGAAAGARGQGWYSFDAGEWHLVALNSNCRSAGGCQAGSPQERWLRADLERSAASCTLAYWHHPRFSSGLHGDDDRTAALWDALREAGAELVLTGHDHDYERLVPLGGIREFVVGTGGAPLYPIRPFRNPASQVARNDAFGILELTLRSSGYDWRFVRTDGRVLDRGQGSCHEPSPG
jgi:3',5'-cyclic AMP phosphodiesterase CpdA